MTSNHRHPTITAASKARNAFQRDNLATAKGWANRSDLSGFTLAELTTARACVARSPAAHLPLYSSERMAFRKLSAELDRRGA